MPETLKHQSSGDLVKVAQYMMGYAERKEASGIFDADFVAFVCSWQGSHGLVSDGVIGKDTWSKIADEAPTCSTGKNKTSAFTCALQILVGGLDADGIYGSKTKQAVAAYQASCGLVADGICGPKTWAKLIGASSSAGKADGGTGAGQTVSGGKILNKCVHYLQWDKRWKNIKYSTHTSAQTIGNSGCGPTSMAMIMATFIDSKITPVEMCKLAVDNGYRTWDSGTKWGFYEYMYNHTSGFSQFIATKSVSVLKAGLAQGALAVCSMNGNDNFFWTRSGHFITAIGYDDSGYIYANDPNKSSAPRKQKEDKFQSCMKQAFIFWPQMVIEEQPVEEVYEYQPPQETLVEKAPGASYSIIDISKWQGDIDFSKVKNAVEFVITRASCGSDKDARFDEYANEMKKYGIPFGVYCYSYAGTIEKAQDEAQKIVSYASKYNPLFYVMDAEEARLTNKTIEAFVRELRRLGVERIGCYVAHNHYKDYNYDSLRSLFNFTWIPRYGKNDGTIEGSTKPDYVCDIWQYSSTGKVPGITGNVDMNVITGQGKQLDWFLDQSGEPSEQEAPAAPATGKKVQICNGNVNVRTAPNTSGSILGVAYNGDILECGGMTDPTTGWISVKYLGQTAWVSNKYGKLV